MSYEPQSPDYTWMVAKIAALYPKEWDLANKIKYGSRTTHFIKILAFEGNKIDHRIGLNGKRGNPFDISPDAIAYKNPTVPERLGACEVRDIIVGSSHSPAWQDVTIISSEQNPEGVPGAWIQPIDPGSSIPDPNPGDGDMQAQIDEMKRQIEELKSKMIKDGDKIGFKTEDWNGEEGMIVCSEKNQGGRLIANRTEVGPWETFKVIKK